MERGLSRPGKRYSLNTPFIVLYVTGISVVCWVVCSLVSNGFPLLLKSSSTPVWKLTTSLLTNEIIAYAIGILFTFGAAILLHRANYALMLIRERTILPFLLYLFYVSSTPNFIPLQASTVCVFCLVIAIYLLFKSYHDEEAVVNAYKTALLLGVGSLVWVHILWFIPLLWRGMYNFKSWSPKIMAASVFGLLTVYWFVFGWCVWQQDFTLFTHSFSLLGRFSLFRFTDLGWVDWISIILVGLITVAATINILTHELEENLRTRQFLWFLILFTCWTLLLFFVYSQSSEDFLQILCIPAAILTAHFFTLKRNKFTYGLFHLMVISCMALLFIRIWNF